MEKKGSVLMITLWILAMLVVFVLGLGHRAAISLRLARYQRDRLKATYLAKAGINRAIVELEKDNQNQWDSLDEIRSTGLDSNNKNIFENIEIKEGTGETFTVGYRSDTDNYICMTDEERKININSAPEELLFRLLKEFNFEDTEAGEIVKYVRIWRGDNHPSLQVDDPSYNDFKKKLFGVPEELILILEYFYQNKGETDYRNKAQQLFNNLKNLITVYGDNKVNINTASKKVLEILITACFNKLKVRGIPVENPEGLLEAIMLFREKPDGFFTATNLDQKLDGLTNPQKNILNDSVDGLKNKICVQSNKFRIESQGKVGNTTKNIIAVFDRTPNKNKIVYWHEN